MDLDKRDISIKLSEFIWDFKIGDNIAYNLKILFHMYDLRGNNSDHILNKPIIIFLVSIIEALLIDLLYHLDQGTNDFPISIDETRKNELKSCINSQKSKEIKNDPFLGEQVYYKIKNYNFSEILKIYEDFNILGPTEHDTYARLKSFSWLRNRIHIQNYHNNFERDENIVFTFKRLKAIEDIFVYLLNYLSSNYKRNITEETKSANANIWFNSMS